MTAGFLAAGFFTAEAELRGFFAAGFLAVEAELRGFFAGAFVFLSAAFFAAGAFALEGGLFSTAWAAARRATGTLKGEQDT